LLESAPRKLKLESKLKVKDYLKRETYQPILNTEISNPPISNPPILNPPILIPQKVTY
jgi:hypothetical protein